MTTDSTCTKSHDSYVVVGALVRTEGAATRSQLDALTGVSTFDVADPHRIGVLIEATSLDEAHARLEDEIRPIQGVLGTWPIALEIEDDTALPDEDDE